MVMLLDSSIGPRFLGRNMVMAAWELNDKVLYFCAFLMKPGGKEILIAGKEL